MDAEAIRLATETISLNSLHLLGVSILVWDHILTLGDEIRFVWLRNKSTSSTWFLLVRYIGLLGNVPVVIFSFTTVSSAACVKYTLIHQVMLVLTQIIVSLVMIIRTFALYSRNKRVLVFLIVVSACFIGVSVWAEHGQHAIPATALPGCHLGASETTGYHLSASWIALFVFDTLIFALTLHKTVATRRDVGFDAPLPLHMALVRDGALYFAAMAFANLSNIVTEYLTGPLIRGSLSTFANCVSISMMCRLMLNLHRIARLGILSSASPASTPRWPSRSIALNLDSWERKEASHNHADAGPSNLNQPRAVSATMRPFDVAHCGEDDSGSASIVEVLRAV